MTREIKFRAWDKKNKELFSLENFALMQTKDGLQIQDFQIIAQIPHKYIEIHQFTGFKDRNGKEIWENDLLQNTAKIIWVVEWNEVKGAWRYVRGGCSEQPYGKTGFGLTYNSSLKMEVIGNIYENKELLT